MIHFETAMTENYPVTDELLSEIADWRQSPGHVSPVAMREGRVLDG